MTSKQRAYLMSLASTLSPIFQVGKSSLTPELTEAIGEAFNTRELIKIAVLKNCFDDCNQIAQMLAERTRSEVVQVIGKKIVLYRESKTKKRNEFIKFIPFLILYLTKKSSACISSKFIFRDSLSTSFSNVLYIVFEIYFSAVFIIFL